MFRRDQLDRYARHIVLPGVGPAGQAAWLRSRVLVVGAGGLGSPVLLYLAAAGVGTLELFDSDVLELPNLQRQVLHRGADLGRPKADSARDALRALNPDVEILARAERFGPENADAAVRAADLVIDGSDNFETRYLVSDVCVRHDTPLLFGAADGFEGQLALLLAHGPEGRGPCYRCLFPEPPPPGTVPSCAEAGVLGALTGVIGSMMAVEALKALLGQEGQESAPAGTLLHYDAVEARLQRIALRRDPDCAACGVGRETANSALHGGRGGGSSSP